MLIVRLPENALLALTLDSSRVSMLKITKFIDTITEAVDEVCEQLRTRNDLSKGEMEIEKRLLLYGWDSFLQQGGVLRVRLLFSPGRSHSGIIDITTGWLDQIDAVLSRAQATLSTRKSDFGVSLAQEKNVMSKIWHEMVAQTSSSCDDDSFIHCPECKLYFHNEDTDCIHTAVFHNKSRECEEAIEGFLGHLTLSPPSTLVDISQFEMNVFFLETKLKALKDSRKSTAKQFLNDIATYRDQLEFQLFHLITAGDPHSQGFEDDISDAAITVNYLRRIVAPQTCAVNKQELLHLVKDDHVQKLHESVAEERDIEALKLNGVQATNIRDYATPLSIHTCLISVYGRLQFVEENKTVFLPDLLGGQTSKLTAVAHCRLIDKIVDSEKYKYWVLYGAGECLSIYNIDKHFGVNRSTAIHSVFPELELHDLPGAVTRSSSTSSKKLQWNAFGFDTGHVVLSVFCVESRTVHRKLIKFSGPISILTFLQRTSSDSQGLVKEVDDTSYRDEEFIVISSTLGPVAVWKCFYEAEGIEGFLRPWRTIEVGSTPSAANYPEINVVAIELENDRFRTMEC
ncbi:unnamed protein product [Angiostrongylus costaricensis]|uniref:C2H2-type domain-containing protein n=1 Tax=Angiostrongylus costaricensis TaxID=334426 RepID=A0A158PM32_ANGCS|nr:unnamed protein product [Angiostrongylus costaricensis]